MAEEGTLCIRQDVLDECGANANATYSAEAYTNRFIKKAEGKICCVSRYDWVANYASISTRGKEFLRNLTAQFAANKILKQDMSGFTSRQEALIMVNMMWADIAEDLKKLETDNFKQHILKGDGTI
jgi:hypothetical protein